MFTILLNIALTIIPSLKHDVQYYLRVSSERSHIERLLERGNDSFSREYRENRGSGRYPCAKDSIFLYSIFDDCERIRESEMARVRVSDELCNKLILYFVSGTNSSIWAEGIGYCFFFLCEKDPSLLPRLNRMIEAKGGVYKPYIRSALITELFFMYDTETNESDSRFWEKTPKEWGFYKKYPSVKGYEDYDLILRALYIEQEEVPVFFFPDVAVGPVHLRDSKTSAPFLRKTGEVTILYNDNEEYCELIPSLEGNKGEVDRIRIGYSKFTKRGRHVTFPFITESGIKLGLSREEFIKIQGNKGKRIREGGKTIYRFVWDAYEDSPFLQAYNARVYVAEYTFVEGFLVEMSYGFSPAKSDVLQ